MQILWRTLPRLALPAAIGLGVAYLATSFVPRPAPNLRPPEELRALGQGFAEESPVRAVLERNVMMLESPLFYPLGQPPAPVPQLGKAAAPPPAQAAFAPADINLAPHAAAPQDAAANLPAGATAPLSGGSSVQGQAAHPVSASPQSAPVFPASASPVSAPAASHQSAQPAAQPRSANPAAAPAQAAVPTAPDRSLDGLRLMGVVAGGEQPLAMFQADGAAVSLHVGEQVRGWTLVSVEPGQVTLRRGTALRHVVLGAPRP